MITTHRLSPPDMSSVDKSGVPETMGFSLVFFFESLRVLFRLRSLYVSPVYGAEASTPALPGFRHYFIRSPTPNPQELVVPASVRGETFPSIKAALRSSAYNRY